MNLWIGNIAPGTSDEEIREFVRKFVPDLECVRIQRIYGDGTRQTATLEFSCTPYGAVEKISMRLNGRHWKGRELYAQTLSAPPGGCAQFGNREGEPWKSSTKNTSA
jgi:hypothetical protein